MGISREITSPEAFLYSATSRGDGLGWPPWPMAQTHGQAQIRRGSGPALKYVFWKRRRLDPSRIRDPRQLNWPHIAVVGSASNIVSMLISYTPSLRGNPRRVQHEQTTVNCVLLGDHITLSPFIVFRYIILCALDSRHQTGVHAPELVP